jgi:iron complex outermembrane receptor protein
MGTVRRLWMLLFLAGLSGIPVATVAAQGVSVTGTVTSGAIKVANATVVLEGTTESKTSKTAADGTFTITGVPPGSYHLLVRADGYLMLRSEITVAASPAPLDVKMNADPHYSEVVSVSPDARSQFDSYQPTSVLGGQDLAKKLQGTIGATLADEPGVAARAFGPGPSRPVIRGLDGDRVLVLEDGRRMGDLSSQSGDHGVNLNPASAKKIEVVRGPATLLYGANAIGGLVNVLTDTIPTAPVTAPTGQVTFDLASAAGEGGGAGAITAGRGAFAVHLSASGRRAGDYKSPDGEVANSFNRSGALQFGASFVKANGYLGASLGYDKSHYGIPFVEEGETHLNPRRVLFDARGERRNLAGPFSSVRASIGMRRYKHNELDGEEIATTFTNDTNEFEVMATHRPAGRLKGTIGVQALTRAFTASGEEALAPPIDQRGVAVFLYEEAMVNPHLTFQFGARVDRTSFDADGAATSRSFTNTSGSVGLLLHPTETTTVAFSLARAARNPALEELYFLGPHPGNNAFERGNDQLSSERALGFDGSFRWQGSRATGEVTYFTNKIDKFIFREFTGEIEDGLPDTFFTQGDARLTGIESHIDVRASDLLWLEAGLDYVRGRLTADSTPLPRMPPLRGRVGVRVQKNALQFGAAATFAAKQDRVFTTPTDDGPFGETATDGYKLFKLFAAYSFVAGRTTNTLAARLENSGNTRYQNHLNYLKDLAPEVGRDFRVTFTVGF